MSRLSIYLVVCLSCVLASCNSPQTDPKGAASEDHVWKSQVQAIDRAREVEGVLKNHSRAERGSAE